MRWRTLMVALVAPSAMAEMSFINPASSSSGGGTLATNPVFMLQTLVTVKWTGTTSNSSSTVVLWQVNASLATPSGDADQLNAAVMGDLEYVARKYFEFPMLSTNILGQAPRGDADLFVLLLVNRSNRLESGRYSLDRDHTQRPFCVEHVHNESLPNRRYNPR